MNNPLQFLPDFSHQNDTSQVLTITVIPISPLGPFGLVSEFSFHRMQSVQKLASTWFSQILPLPAIHRILKGWAAHQLFPSSTIPILSWFLNVSHAFAKRFSTMETVSARPHNIFTMAPKVAEWCFNLFTCKLFATCTAACANHKQKDQNDKARRPKRWCLDFKSFLTFNPFCIFQHSLEIWTFKSKLPMQNFEGKRLKRTKP